MMLPRPARDHAGDHGLIAPDHAVEIDPQHAIPFRRGHLVNDCPRLDGGGADEAVDLAELVLDRRGASPSTARGRRHRDAASQSPATSDSAAMAGSSTSQTTTRAPAAAAAHASARPMPLAPPVMTITSPSASKRARMVRTPSPRAETISKSRRPTRVAVSTRLFTVCASRRQTPALACRVAQTSSPGA